MDISLLASWHVVGWTGSSENYFFLGHVILIRRLGEEVRGLWLHPTTIHATPSWSSSYIPHNRTKQQFCSCTSLSVFRTNPCFSAAVSYEKHELLGFLMRYFFSFFFRAREMRNANKYFLLPVCILVLFLAFAFAIRQSSK